MLLITRTQGLIAGAGMVLVDAAGRAGVLDASDRLRPAIEAGRAWSNLANRWSNLAPPTARLDPDLVRAAAEVCAASREFTHNTTTMATPEVIAARPGLPGGIAVTLHALEPGSELAYVVAEKADAPNHTGPARALSIRAHNDIEAGLAAPHPGGDVVWVSPTDILARRVVPAPRPVTDSLRLASGPSRPAAGQHSTRHLTAWPPKAKC